MFLGNHPKEELFNVAKEADMQEFIMHQATKSWDNLSIVLVEEE